jgi:hypothetical protein
LAAVAGALGIVFLAGRSATDSISATAFRFRRDTKHLEKAERASFSKE